VWRDSVIKEKCILAHDVGTRSNKAVLVKLDSSIVGTASAGYGVSYPEKGCAEQSPQDWWNAVVDTTHELLQSTGVGPSDVVGVVFSTQMAGTLPVADDGSALMPCMIWLDTRAAETAERICGGPLKIAGYDVLTLLRFLRITGGVFGHAGKDVICKILWLKENRPDLYSKAFKFLGCKDYLLYRCTGSFVTSRDEANVTWLMDTRKGRMDWSGAILRKYGIERAKLPQIKKSTELAGKLTKEAADETGLNVGTPVVVGAGDMASAAVGSGSVLENEVHAYVGTSSWIACHTPDRKKDIMHYIGSICSANPNMYLCVAEQETGGACLDWAKDNLFREKGEESYRVFDELAASAEPGSNGLIFTPWLFGERAPLDNPTVRGGFYNLSLEHSQTHFVRSIFEGVAFNMKWALSYLEKLSKRAEAINIIGGGAVSSVWCQIFADVLNRRVRQVNDSKEAGAKGAAIVAEVALGHINGLEDAAGLVKIEKTFEPQPKNVQLYERIFEEFKDVYKNNRQMYRRLNKGKPV
jgi:xylulokinase